MIYRKGRFDIENRLAADGKCKCKKIDIRMETESHWREPRRSAPSIRGAGSCRRTRKKRRPLNGFKNRFGAALSPSPAGERDSWGNGKHQTITGFWESCCICCYFAILVAKFIRICATSARVAVPVGSRRLPPIPALPESRPEPTAQRTAATAQSEVALASL